MERQVSVRLPAHLCDELDRRARKRRRTRADVIRAAPTAFLELPDRALEVSPAERVRDLIGSVAGLPADLATHPERDREDLGLRR